MIGLAEAVIMLGGIVGAFAAPWLRSGLSVPQALILLIVSGALLMLLAAYVMPSPAVAIPLAIPLILAPATNEALFAIVLRRTPPETHGRVNNGLLQVAVALAAVAPLLSGLVVEQASAAWALVLFATALAAVVPIALVLRSVPDETDDPDPPGGGVRA